MGLLLGAEQDGFVESEQCKRRKLCRRLETSSECPVIGDLSLLGLFAVPKAPSWTLPVLMG